MVQEDRAVVEGINRISVKGFKSLANESTIEIRPLTILAGTNSSGKSSIMQPILLMKQTLASSFDPGALLLNGPHARFTSVEQMLSHLNGKRVTDTFSVEVGTEDIDIKVFYYSNKKPGLRIERMEVVRKNSTKANTKSVISTDMTKEDVHNYSEYFRERDVDNWEVKRDFCFLRLIPSPYDVGFYFDFTNDFMASELNRLIHLPGLRGNPERTYTTTAVDELHNICRGTFEKYTASIIHEWQESGDTEKLLLLGQQMKLLGLTEQVKTKQINDTEVEVFVSRTLGATNEEDWVSIADVGLGVSQTLPVAVALLFAEPGQVVYIEQPEIHLHPRAQYNLAKLLAHAATRGVKVVIETHSSLLLRGLQTLVATVELDNDLVALHWFTRDEQGATVITSADLDEIGASGLQESARLFAGLSGIGQLCGDDR